MKESHEITAGGEKAHVDVGVTEKTQGHGEKDGTDGARAVLQEEADDVEGDQDAVVVAQDRTPRLWQQEDWKQPLKTIHPPARLKKKFGIYLTCKTFIIINVVV